MPKFVLIDQSIIDPTGHHYEHSVRVLQAARAAGYTPFLATNRRYRLAAALPWEVRPCYEYTFWSVHSEPLAYRLWKQFRAGWQAWWFRRRVNVRFSVLTLLWLSRKEPTEFVRGLQALPSQPFAEFAVLVVLLYALKLAGALFDLARALLPLAAYVKGVMRAAGRLSRLLVFPIILVLKPPKWLLQLTWARRKRSAFCRDTLRLFRSIRLEQGDIVFVPTLAEDEMLGLLDYFQRDPAARRASWHLLFRRNIFDGYEPDYDRQEAQVRPLRNAFRYFRQQLTGQSVHFWTDTEPLARQYRRLGAGPFERQPVPVSADYHAPERAANLDGRPLNIIYIGDARSEKGFQYLPSIVQDLWMDYVATHRVVFTIQSNFSIPAGEPAAVVARSQLESLAGGTVLMIKEPLDSDGYRDLVLSGDVALILYEAQNYYARSSGIFVEALVAGVPVVVPAGSWMAVQLNGVVGAYHQRLRETLPLLASHTGTQVKWKVGPRRRLMLVDQQADEMLLAGVVPWSCRLEIPDGATHLLAAFAQDDRAAGCFVGLTIEQRDGHRSRLRQERVIVGGEACGRASALFQLAPAARTVRLVLQNQLANVLTRLQDIQFDFICAPQPLPRSAVGVVYSGPERITGSVKEVVDHAGHYSASAREFSRAWSAYHSSTELVRQLAESESARGPGPASQGEAVRQ